MTTNFLEPEIKQAVSRPSILSLQEAAETIQADALQYARTMSIQPIRAADIGELLQRQDFFDYFKFGLAKRIANTLAAHDDCVQEIYYFDPNLNPDAETETTLPFDTTVNLLVTVSSKSAALESFIAALDGALTAQIKRLAAPQYSKLTSILNTILITDEDVKHARGYAALLSSMYLKPRKIL